LENLPVSGSVDVGFGAAARSTDTRQPEPVSRTVNIGGSRRYPGAARKFDRVRHCLFGFDDLRLRATCFRRRDRRNNLSSRDLVAFIYGRRSSSPASPPQQSGRQARAFSHSLGIPAAELRDRHGRACFDFAKATC
jgi:hypothetical protein